MFAKRHHETIARLLYNAKPFAENGANPRIKTGRGDMLWQITSDLADLFERDNPQFDRGRFLRAANMG